MQQYIKALSPELRIYYSSEGCTREMEFHIPPVPWKAWRAERNVKKPDPLATGGETIYVQPAFGCVMQ